MKNIGIVIQARMGSTRLPHKVLLSFCRKPMLQFQIEILQKYNLGYDILVATTSNKEDKEIVKFCKKINIKCYSGNVYNVFDRYCKVAEKFNYETIVRLTADNPLVSYAILNEAISSHVENQPDLTTTRDVKENGKIISLVPKGLSVDVINSKTLLSIDGTKLTQFQKEHVIPVFYKRNYIVNLVESPINYTDDLSIDTLQDFNRVQDFTNSLIRENNLWGYLGYG